MARYAAPKTLGSIFNNEVYSFANVNSAMNNLATNLSVTNTENVLQSINIMSNGDTLSLSDGLIKQISDDLSITTEDGYTLSLNKDKPTTGDLLINEGSYHSNVVIANGNLTLKNGYLNLGKNGTLILNGADVNAVLVNNKFQLQIQADTLVNHDQTLNVHSTGIQESTDLGVNNSTKIVQIESSYAPLDAPVFTTSLALPPIIIVDSTNVSSTQIGYLSNLTGDVQTGLNSINSAIQTVQAQLVVDASNISVLQTNLATVTSKQLVDESNISTLQSSLATVTSKQVTDEADIATLQSSLSLVASKQVTDEADIATLQSSLSLVSSKQVTDEANIATLQSSLSFVASKQVTDEADIATLQSSLSLVSSKQVTDESNISALQSSVLNISNKQVTDEANIATLQTDMITKAPLVSPTFSGTPQVPTASANTNSAQIASTSYVDTAISSLVGSSPNLLNTLQEINEAINNDPNFATSIANQISLKANIASPTFSGTVSLPSMVDNGSVACSNGFSVSGGISISSGTVSFPSKSISIAAVNSDSISAGYVDFTSSGQSQINSLNNTINNINSSLTGISYSASSGTTISNNLTLPAKSIATSAINNGGYFALSSALSNYALNSALSSYALVSSLANYVTSSSLPTTLSSYALSSALSSYALTSSLANYVTSSSLTTTLGSYALNSALSSYALTSSLTSYVTSSSLSTTLGSYVTSSSLTTTLGSYALSSALSSYALTSSLSSYLTTATASSTYATTTAVANILNGTSSFTAFTNSGATNLNGLTNISELSETISSVAVASGLATCNYTNGAVFFITGQTANFTLALTNFTPAANKVYSITLLISSSASKFYANALLINSTSTSFVYNGGSAAVSVSSATYIVQQFNIVYTASTSAPAFVICSIGQAY
jgi:hypothetical protein